MKGKEGSECRLALNSSALEGRVNSEKPGARPQCKSATDEKRGMFFLT